MIDVLEKNDDDLFAKAMEEEQESERITAGKLRPIVDRLLKPPEIPVRYERTYRRWG